MCRFIGIILSGEFENELVFVIDKRVFFIQLILDSFDFVLIILLFGFVNIVNCLLLLFELIEFVLVKLLLEFLFFI